MKKRGFSEPDLREISSHFQTCGKFVRSRYLKVGHINDTYLVEVKRADCSDRYIFQRINRYVFQDPEKLMANFAKITRHMRQKLENIPGRNPDRETLNLVRSNLGESYYHSASGEYWRAYRFVGDAHIINIAREPRQAYEAGKAFGCFQKLLCDLPASSLHETIPHFHHGPRRFARFKEVVEKDSCSRASGAKEAIAFVFERKPIISIITEDLESGLLPLRVTHNDTKINNILFEDRTGKALCVIDLDTTMPGSVLYDFGDMVRTTTCFTAEDERDLTRVRMEMEMFRALTEGYLEEAGEILTPREIGLLVFSGRLVTLTIGLRFLTDYLEGDVYFRTHRPGQNLDRARVQFALVKSMEEQEQEMERCLRTLVSR